MSGMRLRFRYTCRGFQRGVCRGQDVLGNLVRFGSSGRDILSSWTAISPNVPSSLNALLGSHSADFRARDAFVVTVVPLSNVLGDFDCGATLKATASRAAVWLPGQWPRYSNIEQLECPLGSFPGRDVAVSGRLPKIF